MPKCSLKRRHHRQQDLTALPECSGDSLTRTTAARMVSDDDIQISSEETRKQGDGSASSSSTSLCPCPLKRRAPSGQLSDMVLDLTPQKPFVESKFLCVSPTRSDPRGESSRGSSSPWGHFVDMLIPASSGDEDFAAPTPEKSQHRFLPFCPEPDVLAKRRHHPYRLSARPKPRRHRSDTDKNFAGFVMKVGESSAVKEAQDALMGLHV